MSAERDPLDELIESAADRRDIDWEGAEAGAPDEESRARVRALRDLSRIADFNRTLQRGAAAGGEAPPTRWGELLVLEAVGSGASGDVYRAWELSLQREVALKLLRASEGAEGGAAALLEEARALARVHHPGVVAIHGVAEHDGRPGLWMEYLHGVTLEAKLAAGAPLPAAEVARIGAALARALAAAHAAGVLHRDLKPVNVLLALDGRVVLMDFGLGQRARAGAPTPAPFSGTPLYMSPARLNGASATAADDVYALGVTLRRALAGRLPFEATTLEALRAESQRGPTRPLAAECPAAPPALVAAIERAMAPDPARRTASAAELAAALESLPAAAAATPRRGRDWSALALAAVLALVAVGAWALWPRQPQVVIAPTRASAPAPGAPAVAASVPYDVGVGFIRHDAAGETRLAAGDRVGPGDRLSLEFHASRPAWVYVLDADDRGETYLLFPQPMFDRHNPIVPDSLVRLPGPIGGRENTWTVTSRGGREHFLVVASPEPVAELEQELGRIPAPARGRAVEYARIETSALERLRGVGGVNALPSGAAPAGPSGAFERFRALAGRERGVQGVWIRQITLENPLR